MGVVVDEREAVLEAASTNEGCPLAGCRILASEGIQVRTDISSLAGSSCVCVACLCISFLVGGGCVVVGVCL